MPNSVDTDILNVYDLQTEFVDNILNKPEFSCLYTVKWFQVLLSNTDSFICTQLNGFKYYYITLTIQFNISHLFAHS